MGKSDSWLSEITSVASGEPEEGTSGNAREPQHLQFPITLTDLGLNFCENGAGRRRKTPPGKKQICKPEEVGDSTPVSAYGGAEVGNR